MSVEQKVQLDSEVTDTLATDTQSPVQSEEDQTAIPTAVSSPESRAPLSKWNLHLLEVIIALITCLLTCLTLVATGLHVAILLIVHEREMKPVVEGMIITVMQGAHATLSWPWF